MAYYKSLFEYVQVLEREGLLFRVKKPINKDTEMHPLVRWQFRGLNEEQRRAFYFENIHDAKGKKYDIPVLIGGLAASQRIYALGLMCKEEEVEDIWSKALEKPIEPILIKEGEAQEVVYQGDELIRRGGLYMLPIPISTPGFDNAPYLTAGCWITKDPDNGVRNMGVYRGQIKGPLKTSIMWGSLKHTAIHWEKCNERGVPLDAAIVIGGPPCITYKKNPIDVSMISQLTPSESSKIKQSAYESLALNHLNKEVGVKALRVALYEDLLTRQVAVIQIKKEKPNDTWRALEALLPSRVIHKIIVCVDEDIDPHDAQSLLWAMANRCQPHRDMRIVPNRPLPWNPIRYVADGEHYDVTDSTLLVDATLKADFPPVALPKRPYMERAREIWEELELPKLNPRPPWSGYSLGMWPQEAAIQAENAVAGNHSQNAEYSAKKGIKVPRGSKFMDLKKKYMADEIEKLKKHVSEKDERK